ncbi:hypothetical protein GCM10010862_10770 [Devosia nitrariae]|uniref:Uncharacterized protein n=1 Tax=Devosia nitrariae TaxID=2071872 RepID=A0ABQ5W1D5_9HYPH|nr:hypothetical protein GCM10010862_10770 [Devosia nitrariae]
MSVIQALLIDHNPLADRAVPAAIRGRLQRPAGSGRLRCGPELVPFRLGAMRHIQAIQRVRHQVPVARRPFAHPKSRLPVRSVDSAYNRLHNAIGKADAPRDHMAFEPSSALFRHFIGDMRGPAGSV